MKKRILALILILCMCLTILPTAAVADDSVTTNALELEPTATTLNISYPKDDTFYSWDDSPTYIEWNSVTGAAGYYVRVLNTGTKVALVDTVWTDSTKLYVDFPSENGSYKIWVGAVTSSAEKPVESFPSGIIWITISHEPEVSLDGCDNITSGGATLTMTVSKDYGAGESPDKPIIDCGFYVGTSSKVSRMTKYSFADYGSYSSRTKGTKSMTITNLKPGTKYYYCAYAENLVGEEYTDVSSFTTKSSSSGGDLSVSKSSVSFSWSSTSSSSVTVTCGGTYSVSEPDYDVPSSVLNSNFNYEWLDVSKSGSTLKFTPNRPNYSASARTATVTVSYGGKSKDITVTQKACGESAPKLTLKRAGTTVSSGDYIGNFALPQSAISVDIASKTNVRRLTAQLREKNGIESKDTDNEALDDELIVLNLSALPAGEYKILVYASNSPTENDYYKQSPFSEEPFVLYFTLSGGGGPGGGGGGSTGTVPTTLEEARAMVIFSMDKKPKSVEAGKVRHIPQCGTIYETTDNNGNKVQKVTTPDPYWCPDYWICQDVNGKSYDTTRFSRGWCTRAVYSMALSYFGIDCTPGKMAALKKTEGDLGPNHYDGITEIIEKSYPGLERVKSASLSKMFDSYEKDGSYSPVYVYFGAYNGSDGHAILVIGRDKTDRNKYYCVDPSFSGSEHMTTMVVNDTGTKATDYSWSSCRGRSILYCYQWRYKNSASCTITYNANGGSGSMSSDTVNYGSNYTIKTNTFTRTGYTFQGWALSSGGSIAYYDGDTIPNIAGSITLYALWKANTVTVSYNANGGSGSMSSDTVNYGSSYKIKTNTFTRTGYTFQGWATSSGGSVVYSAGATISSVTSNITLYAVWKANTVTVSYNANGGSGSMSSDTVNYGSSYKIKANGFKKTGHTFQGWATSSTGSVQYGDSASISKVTKDITLYAVWKANTYTISYNANGGSGTMSSDTVTYGSSYKIKTNTFTYTDHTFKGWATSSDGNVKYSDGATISNITGNIPLYAVWSLNHTHSYIYSVSKEPTTTSTGTITGTCSCGDSATVTLPKLSTTDYTYKVTKEAGCTEDGSATYTWKTTTYGSFAFNVTLSKLGHDYHDGKCSHCGADDPNVSTTTKLIISNETARKGETVVVKLSVKEAPPLKSMVITGLTYDKNVLELVKGEWKLENSVIASWDSKNETGVIAFSENVDVNNTILELSFKVKDSAAGGDYDISCLLTANTKLQSGAETAVAVGTEKGKITVVSVIRGDVNGDNLVTSDDAIYLLYHTLMPSLYPINQNADFNGDGMVTSDDAIHLLYHTLMPSLYPLH